MVLHVPVENLITGHGDARIAQLQQILPQRMSDVNFLQRELARLELRIHVFQRNADRPFPRPHCRCDTSWRCNGGRIPRRARRQVRSSRTASVRIRPRTWHAGACFSRWSNNGAICGQSPRSMFCGTNFRARAGAVYRMAINSSAEPTKKFQKRKRDPGAARWPQRRPSFSRHHRLLQTSCVPGSRCGSQTRSDYRYTRRLEQPVVVWKNSTALRPPGRAGALSFFFETFW